MLPALFGERGLAKKIVDYAEDLNAVEVIENIRGETGMLEIVGLLEPHLNREDVCREGFRKLLEGDFLRDSKRMKNGFASGKLRRQMTDWMNQVVMAATRSHESNTHIQSMGCVILKRLIEKEPDTIMLNARVQFLLDRLKGSLESPEVQVESMRALDTQMHVRVSETVPLVATEEGLSVLLTSLGRHYANDEFANASFRTLAEICMLELRDGRETANAFRTYAESHPEYHEMLQTALEPFNGLGITETIVHLFGRNIERDE